MNAVDTNVLVYACDKRDPIRQSTARELLRTLTDGITLWQVACEFIAASRKLAGQGFTPAEAWGRLAEYLDLFPMRLPTTQVLERARAMHLNEQWSFWDATLVAACREAGVTQLFSEDLPGRNPPAGLQIVNPFA